MTQTQKPKIQATEFSLEGCSWYWTKYDGSWAIRNNRADMTKLPENGMCVKVWKNSTKTETYEAIGPLLTRNKYGMVFEHLGHADPIKSEHKHQVSISGSDSVIDLKSGQDPEYDEYLQEVYGRLAIYG